MGLFDAVTKAVITNVMGRFNGASGGAIFRGATLSSGAMVPKGGQDLLQAFNETPWLRATVGKKAGSFAGLEWQVKRTLNGPAGRPGSGTIPRVDLQLGAHDYRRKAMAQMMVDGSAQIVEGHPLPVLLKNACPALPGTTPMFLGEVYYEITGEAFYYVDRGPRENWIQGKSARGFHTKEGNYVPLAQPTALWPIPPIWVRRTPTPADPTFDIRNGALNLLGIPMSDLIWLKQPDPINPYARGIGYAQCVRDEVAADEAAARMVSFGFVNRGRPDLLVALEGVSDRDLQALRNDWVANLQGVQNALKTYFVSQKMQVEKLAYDFEHLQVLELRDYHKKLLRQTQGIPPEMLGDQDQSNRSTSEAASHIYNTQVVIPMADAWREFFQSQLLPEYDSRAVLDYITPVSEDREFALQTVEKGCPVRVNELRKLGGFDPLPPAEGGEMWIVGGAISPTLQGAAAQAAQAAAPGFGGAPGAPPAAAGGAPGQVALNVPHAPDHQVSLQIGAGAPAPPMAKVATVAKVARIPKEPAPGRGLRLAKAYRRTRLYSGLDS